MVAASTAVAKLAGRRIVAVTGIGAVTPLGNNFYDSYRALVQNQSGVTTLAEALEHGIISSAADDNEKERDFLADELDRASQLPCQVAASVRPYNDSDNAGGSGSSDSSRSLYNPRTTPRFVQFALRAAEEALEHAGLLRDSSQQKGLLVTKSHQNRRRIGVSIGSGMSAVREISRAAQLQSLRKLSPYFVPNVLSNSASGRVAIQYGLGGPNLSQSTACAASTHAIGDAMRCIQYNQADIMLAGGSESAIDVLSLAGFTRLKALSTSYNDTPAQASRPFDTNRDGFVMGEGCAILVLEELQHALIRQQPILALLTGYGTSCDGYHITAPEPNGVGAQLCMERALRDAFDNGIGEDSILAPPLSGGNGECCSIYVNAHATSTPKGDDIEAKAIERTFFGGTNDDETENNGNETENENISKCHSYRRVLVSSTKGSTGHLLGAAGAVEAAFTIQALREKSVPPTLNLHDPLTDVSVQKQARVELVRDDEATAVDDLDVAISNSFGFGGTNACIVFQRWNE